MRRSLLVSWCLIALTACDAGSESPTQPTSTVMGVLYQAGAPDASLGTQDAGVDGGACEQRGVDSHELTGTANALVLYDTASETGYLGELYGAAMGTLASHFGKWRAAPVAQYKKQDLAGYSTLIYIGSSYDEPLPAAFLDDVASAKIPVLWIDQNIWQLVKHVSNFAKRYGFEPSGYDMSAIAKVKYKGVTLDRDTENDSGVMAYARLNSPATALAQAVRPDGSTFPWAVRSGNFTYVGENPFDYVNETDRYLALCDILFDVFGVHVEHERHRAMVRIEDVSAYTDPDNLRKLADYLASEQVPFSIATIPQYMDPLGAYNEGTPVKVALHEAPPLVSALHYMVDHGGTVIMHGYTHQYSNVKDPYTAVSADDVEFYLTHVDASNNVIYDGPVPEDSEAWAGQRILNGLHEFDAAGLARPTIFEWPHYAASDVDAHALRHCFTRVYHQALYFSGILNGNTPNYQQSIDVFAPYVTQDAYGFEMIPENLGLYSPMASNQNPAHSADDLVRAARANLVVRDGFASFFFHGFFSVDELRPIVAGIKAAGYEFTAAAEL